MRKIISILCILLLIICIVAPFSSCSQPVSNAIDSSQPSESPEDFVISDEILDDVVITGGEEETAAETTRYDLFLDREQSHKPTYEEAMCITEGMSCAEVIARLGKPHKRGEFAAIPSFRWYMEDDMTILIVWKYNEEVENRHDPETVIRFGVVYDFIIEEQ